MEDEEKWQRKWQLEAAVSAVGGTNGYHNRNSGILKEGEVGPRKIQRQIQRISENSLWQKMRRKYRSNNKMLPRHRVGYRTKRVGNKFV